MKTVRLNVLLVCYNATKFIEECVNSILMQKTDFKFNIIVADDYSSDDTVLKIKKLARKSKIKFIYLKSEKNLGKNENFKRAFKACYAEYIAVMEGDDFWTTPYRLQTHIDFLDNHKECVMSSNNYFRGNYDQYSFSENNTDFSPYIIYKDNLNIEYLLLNPNEVIRSGRGTNFSTCVYRTNVIMKLMENNYKWGGGVVTGLTYQLLTMEQTLWFVNMVLWDI